MSPNKHKNKIVGETYNLLRNIRIAFTYIDEDMVKKLWHPWSDHDWSMQQYCGHLTPGRISPKLKGYKERPPNWPQPCRLLSMKRDCRHWTDQWPTLEQRTERGHLLTIYRIMNNMELPDRMDLLKRDTRGHGLKHRKDNYRRDQEKQLPP